MNFGPKFDQGLRLIREAIVEAQAVGRPPLTSAQMRAELDELVALRGRPPFFQYLGAGLGRGSRAMLADGRWVLDLALGIGVHLFGHGDLDLIETALRAAASDLVHQGHLVFNREYHALMKTLLAHAPRGMAHCWLVLGADANENALKLVRSKRAGRPGVIAFRGGFHGRTSAMAEITDRPDYRLGQPHTFPVEYLPFYDCNHPLLRGDRLRRCGKSSHATATGWPPSSSNWCRARRASLPRRAIFVPLFAECRRAGIAIWIDEVQTFARTGELFATARLGLGLSRRDHDWQGFSGQRAPPPGASRPIRR